MSSALKDLKLFTTLPHPCSYLEGQRAKTLFIDPELQISCEQHSRLSESGFRRSGQHRYRPFCEHCNGCVPCRIVTNEFEASRRFRRILKTNSDIEVRRVPHISDDECYGLYEHYI